MTKNKRKHHYLPQFYVGSFANKQGEVFVLEHETRQIKKQGKNGTFHIPYFYSVDFTKHKKRDPESAKRIKKLLGIDHINTSNVKEYPDMIEDLLGDSENLGAKIIRKLITGERISALDKAELSMFIALMYTRNPAFHAFVSKLEKQMMDKSIKKFFSAKDKAKAAYDQLAKEGKDMKVSLEEVIKTVEDNRYKIEIPKELDIQNMLILAPVIDKILQNKTWLILEAPSGTSFITNDNPVFLEHPLLYKNNLLSVGFETPGVEVFFPLSKECLLIMRNSPKDGYILRKKIDKTRVRKFNKVIFTRSNKYVIGRDLELIKRLNK